MPQQAPTAPTAPVLAPVQVSVDGKTLASAADVYQAFRAQRRELSNQLESLQDQRSELSRQLQQEPLVTGADRKGIEQRITSIDEQISVLDKQIAEANAQVAKSAAVPGATAEPPQPPRQGPPEEFYVLTGIFGVIVLVPLTIAYARRIWRKGSQVVTTIPKELTERLMRVEQTVEATAIEIERIGEGQRFMTRIFTEGQGAHQLSAAQPATLPTGRPGDVRG
ncbi:MAG TPA: flagellar export protein FliJ [Gemmatimonadaceae bacterium]|nr:flagellar export protein FliJ [Gemmatimonadaceae bacterium]